MPTGPLDSSSPVRCTRGTPTGPTCKSGEKSRGECLEQAELFKHVIDTLERLGIRYMVVGSLASMAYGEPRMTLDIDVVIDVSRGQLDELCAAFPAGEYYVSAEAAREALHRRGQFNVIHPESGNKIDFMISGSGDWHREQLARRQRIPLLPDTHGYVARPEDVIIGKLLFFEEGGSDKHLRDIASMFQTSGTEIDRAYIERWVRSMKIDNAWNAVLERLGQ